MFESAACQRVNTVIKHEMTRKTNRVTLLVQYLVPNEEICLCFETLHVPFTSNT